MDAQLPPALARWLVEQGHEADHVADIGLADASDAHVWKAAQETHAAILTKDADFVTLATFDESGPTVIWIRIGNTRRNELLRWFERLLPRILHSIEQGERLVEIN